jgi:hypothetical protein
MPLNLVGIYKMGHRCILYKSTILFVKYKRAGIMFIKLLSRQAAEIAVFSFVHKACLLRKNTTRFHFSGEAF